MSNNKATEVQKTEHVIKARLDSLIVNDLIDSQLRKQLVRYRKLVRDDGSATVEYTYGINDFSKSGRYYVRNSLGLQMFPSEIRNYLTEALYHDFDLSNSAPNILLNLLKTNGIVCPDLERYVNDRPAVLAECKKKKKDVLELLFTSYWKKKSDRENALENIHNALYKTLVPALAEQDEYKDIMVAAKKKKPENAGGSFLSSVYQKIECNTLKCISRFFESKGFAIDVLIFDGFLTPKCFDDDVMEPLLRECEEYVFENLQLKITLTEKPIVVDPEWLTKYKIVKPKEPKKTGTDEKGDKIELVVKDDEEICIDKAQMMFDVGMMVEYQNHYFGKVVGEDTVWYCSRKTPSSPWIIRNKTSFLQAYEHMRIDTGEKRAMSDPTMLDIWISNPNIRIFNKIVMDPSHVGDVNGNLNLYRGMKAKLVPEIDMDRVNAILYHLKVMNNFDEVAFYFTLNWKAHIVQYPWIKTGSALVFNGKQGTGKNTLVEFFGKEIIGQDHYGYCNNIDDLTGQFTSHHALDIFDVCDEIAFSGANKTNNILKSLITQTKQKFEKKGESPFMVDHFSNYVFLSNHDDAVKIEDEDRRYHVKTTSSKHKGDTDYFNALYKILEQEGTADHFYTYLMNIDLSGFNVRAIPHSEEKEEMRTWVMSPLEQMVEKFMRGDMPNHRKRKYILTADDEEGQEEEEGSGFYEVGNTYKTTMSDLFLMYRHFIQSGECGNRTEPHNAVVFSRKLRRMMKVDNISKNKNGGTPVYLTIERVDLD